MLAERPPMGWNSWNTFGANITEELVMGIADAMVDRGLKDAGYEYVVIDDCWSLRNRDADGRMVADPAKFPHGMKYLSDYIHSKGLKFGMYSCCGTMTCAGYPGSFGHEYVDARTFADWGVDFLKYDNCFKPVGAQSDMMGEQLYRRMGLALKATGRDILFSACNWGTHKVWEWARSAGAHMFRTTGDICDNPQSFKSIALEQLHMLASSAPGCFCDPDMLICGMYNNGNVSGMGGCTAAQYRTHFALWCVTAAPLMIGCDIRNCDEDTLKLLKNRALIAIDQDAEARPPYVVGYPEQNETYLHMFRHLSDDKFCLASFNFTDAAREGYIHLYDIGITPESGYTLELTDALTGEKLSPRDDVIVVHCDAGDCKVYNATLIKK